MKRLILFVLSLCFSFSLSTAAFAQTRVVVIPMSGGSSAPLSNIVTVAKENGDFDNIIEAMASISGASEDNPYLIVIAPGKYTLTEKLTMKHHVSITGSGVDTTILEGSISGGSIYSCFLVGGAEGILISHMTIQNNGGVGCSVGIHPISDTMRIEHVKVIARGAANGSGAYALYNYDSTVTMNDVHLEGIGARSYGAYNNHGGIINIKNSLLKGQSAGVYILTTTTRITNTRISGTVSGDAAGTQCRDTYDVNLGDVNC